MKAVMHRWFVSPVVLVLLVSAPPPARSSEDGGIVRATPEQIAQWRSLRFGMFIHWGPVSLTGKEIGWSRASETTDTATRWQEYDELCKRFDPERFDAGAWADLAVDAGMKYMVFTSKHHDGFCMWDSEYTDYDIMETPFGRDVMGELAAACKKRGIAFGPYHSICDWRHPDYGYSHRAKPGFEPEGGEPDFGRYFAYLKNQLAEMQRKYGPFLVFWFDGEWEAPWTREHGVELNNYCKRLQPDALVNNRVDKGRRGMQGMFEGEGYAGDFGTPEQEIGAFNLETPWETCMTIGKQWAWKPDDEVKTLKECLTVLVNAAGGDGNLLLNVGPRPDGRIEPGQADRLREMGAWLEIHGDGIYGTRGGPYKPGAWGASTRKGNRITLFLTDTRRETFRFPAPGADIAAADLKTGGRLEFAEAGEFLEIAVLGAPADEPVRVVALETGGNAETLPPMDVP